MNVTPHPITEFAQAPVIGDRMRQRLEALGVTVASVDDDGRVSVCAPGKGRWIERLLITAPPFVRAMRQWLATRRDLPGEPEALWPGVWIVPLPSSRRRRSGPPRGGRRHEPVTIALLLGHELIHSEQLRMVCDAQQTDLAATVARIDPATLHSPAQCAQLASVIAWMHQDSLEIDRRLGELQSLSGQLGESYEELSLLYKLSSSMTVNPAEGGPAEFLSQACEELCAVAGLTWMAIKLIDQEPRLGELAGAVFRAGRLHGDDATLRRIGSQLLQQAPQRKGPATIIDDTATLNIQELTGVSRDLLVVELAREGQTFGVLFGGGKLDGSHMSSVDTKLCGSLGNSLTIFLENSMLYEDMHSMFLGTLHALTSSIDAKDRYTRGHSERVALLSRMLAQSCGLPDKTVERVYIAALVHDVGKIGVPEAVLCKPGRLTKEEFDVIKKHPEIGAEILSDIRQMQDLIPGVLYHHERWDGKGYPRNLAGVDIPLFGRLICLADSFDAMSSNRTYRRALELQRVLGEVENCAGTQFDPELAPLFVKMDFDPFFNMLARHNAQAEPPETEPPKRDTP